MLTAKKERAFLDHAIYVASILGPIMTVPQAWEIWSHQSAQDVSLLTWGTYLTLAVIWLLYGILHKEKPLIVLNTLLLMVNTAVVVGIFLYS